VNVLEVKVGEPIEKSLADFGAALQAAGSGKAVVPYFGIGFQTMAQFGAVFTPLWEVPVVGRNKFDPQAQAAPGYEFDQRSAW